MAVAASANTLSMANAVNNDTATLRTTGCHWG
jgi:hypothetical protein